MTKHVLRSWDTDDGSCKCIEYWDDVDNIVVHVEVPKNGKLELQ